MIAVVVNIRVKDGMESAFIEATQANARESVKEAGIARFDFLRSKERPEEFVLYEAYTTVEAQAAHKETAHYLRWRALAEPMMAEPRTRKEFESVFLS